MTISSRDYIAGGSGACDKGLCDGRASSIADSILELPVANIARVNRNIVRGETLWASRNRWCLETDGVWKR